MASINPLRYRGYYYDTETGFYYVQSRYYDPIVKRFINADEVSNFAANGEFLSYNLFAYCGNNPISREDSEGTDWRNVFATGITIATIGILILATLPFGGPLLAGAGVTTATVATTANTAVATGLTVAGGSMLYAISQKVSRPGHMQKEVEKGKAPRDVESVHNAHVDNQKPHVHFKDGTSMNYDGTIHDKLGGVPKITRAIAKWLRGHGWADMLK